MYTWFVERDMLYSRWKIGIERSLGWEMIPENDGNCYIKSTLAIV